MTDRDKIMKPSDAVIWAGYKYRIQFLSENYAGIIFLIKTIDGGEILIRDVVPIKQLRAVN